jgi:hypothetical protein
MPEVALVWVFAEATYDPVPGATKLAVRGVWSPSSARTKTGSRGLSLRGRIGNLKFTKAISSYGSREGSLSSTSC